MTAAAPTAAPPPVTARKIASLENSHELGRSCLGAPQANTANVPARPGAAQPRFVERAQRKLNCALPTEAPSPEEGGARSIYDHGCGDCVMG